MFTLTKEIVGDVANETGKDFRRLERVLFATQGKSGGEQWKPLSPRYARIKMAILTGAISGLRSANQQFGRASRRVPSLKSVNKILSLSGGLRDSLTKKSDPDHVQTFRQRSDAQWVVAHGTSNELARYHSNGVPSKGGAVVRKPIMLTPSQKEEIQKTVTRVLAVHLKRAVLVAARLGLNRIK